MRQPLKKITLLGLFSSLVFVATSVKVMVPMAGKMIHLGNAACVISGLLLGPVYGGLSAGIGSFLFDLFNPIFIFSAPFSFVFKFVMAFVSSKIYESKKNTLNHSSKVAVSSLAGILVYVFLRSAKNFVYNICFFKLTLNAALLLTFKSFLVSLINTVVSVLLSVFVMNKLSSYVTFKDLDS